MKNLKLLDVRSRRQWRDWLEKNHDSESEIGLLFYKRHTVFPIYILSNSSSRTSAASSIVTTRTFSPFLKSIPF